MAEPATEPDAGKDRTTPPRVLVVDDDDALRFALREGLSAYGFEVHDAADGATACRVAAEVRPALVLLDWVMPDGDGGEAMCRRLHEAQPDAAIVMFSGLGDDGEQRAALEAGATACLVKGMELEALTAELHALVASRG